MATRLQQLYESSIRAEMRNEFNYTNPMQVPKLEKIVINMGVGEASQDRKKIEGPIDDLTRVSGQSRLSPARRSRSRALSFGTT